jgi:hypothetical protein
MTLANRIARNSERAEATRERIVQAAQELVVEQLLTEMMEPLSARRC